MHLILDGNGCNKAALDSFEIVHKILDELPEKVGMKKLSSPHLLRGKSPKGITGFIIIEESAIMIHTFPENNFLSFDLYSCNKFDADLVIELVKKVFEIKQLETKILERSYKNIK